LVTKVILDTTRDNISLNPAQASKPLMRLAQTKNDLVQEIKLTSATFILLYTAIIKSIYFIKDFTDSNICNLSYYFFNIVL
jgi:hypothetical protein